ncbi:hypothetical protein FPZ49_21120 [Paenibacillus cremeus]|uniref:Uncharacterized protein n=1 Tax=Paenibacillus cremeus TaxID=2163881 RepID=A0A559K762_9BACL|nr:hypothetical protein FPZ49_21120 [Paenibacillus cremeus]
MGKIKILFASLSNEKMVAKILEYKNELMNSPDEMNSFRNYRGFYIVKSLGGGTDGRTPVTTK